MGWTITYTSTYQNVQTLDGGIRINETAIPCTCTVRDKWGCWVFSEDQYGFNISGELLMQEYIL